MRLLAITVVLCLSLSGCEAVFGAAFMYCDLLGCFDHHNHPDPAP